LAGRRIGDWRAFAVNSESSCARVASQTFPPWRKVSQWSPHHVIIRTRSSQKSPRRYRNYRHYPTGRPILIFSRWSMICRNSSGKARFLASLALGLGLSLWLGARLFAGHRHDGVSASLVTCNQGGAHQCRQGYTLKELKGGGVRNHYQRCSERLSSIASKNCRAARCSHHSLVTLRPFMRIDRLRITPRDHCEQCVGPNCIVLLLFAVLFIIPRAPR
jgi:hypothetical protein